jgi:hypothetical protein
MLLIRLFTNPQLAHRFKSPARIKTHPVCITFIFARKKEAEDKWNDLINDFLVSRTEYFILIFYSIFFIKPTRFKF